MKSILVADDEVLILKLVSSSLNKDGYRVLAFRDGASAFRTLATMPVDLAILDVVLPGLDGFEILRRLRGHERTAKTPVLMLTSLRMEKDIILAKKAGANGYLAKPFSLGDLMRHVHNLLG